ncbi:hypothetical protein FHX42_004297 [Saccharopolyspora lacisalsi]|uniref:DUF397 domain-containing protein n=1 Tax=Halosaccharopolyspora lacisalsi TaxID=1000566 RepID=A0A839E7R8_9PSEU|nr:DUF397 domain-containing protein [Halosaccharopolyspora lacisalsi]MBA8826918.1 hypothetical protein [Halosaccharopolyspora lacisalsi]
MDQRSVCDVLHSEGAWRKSTRSQGQNTCVEVGSAPGLTGVRDSKLGEESPVLAFTSHQWRAFVVSLSDR